MNYIIKQTVNVCELHNTGERHYRMFTGRRERQVSDGCSAMRTRKLNNFLAVIAQWPLRKFSGHWGNINHRSIMVTIDKKHKQGK